MDAAAGGRLLAAAIGPPDPPLQASVQRPLSSHGSENGSRDEDRPEVVVARHVAAAADKREPVLGPEPASTIANGSPPLQVPAEALRISDGERRRLVALAASAGISPRRTKRFANLYRLVKASLSPAERRSFVVENGRGGSFDTVMALLAATTGSPAAADHLLAGLMDLPESYVEASEQFARLLDSIIPTPDERVAWASVRGALRSEPDIPRDLEDLRYWAPRVQRFCFGSMTGSVPGRLKSGEANAAKLGLAARDDERPDAHENSFPAHIR